MSNEVKPNAAEAEERVRTWVRRAQAGDSQAFDNLVREFQRPIFNLAFRMVNHREDAADLTQDIFVKLHRVIGQFRGESAFGTWFYTVAVNVCRSGRRRLGRIANFESVRLDETRPDEDSERPPLEVVDPSDLPGKTLERKEAGQRVREMVAQLPEDLKAILVLRDLQGMAYEEIAEVLGCNLGTVKSRLFRARLEMKERLSREGLLCTATK